MSIQPEALRSRCGVPDVLAPTVIELMTIECDEFGCTEAPAGSTTVYGTWSGVGPVTSQKARFTWDDGMCVQVQAEKGTFREASFTGPFDAQFAQMSSGRYRRFAAPAPRPPRGGRTTFLSDGHAVAV